MLKRLLCLALVAGLGLAGLAMTRSAVAGQDDDPRVAELVKKLGSMNYAVREKAKKDLETIGMGALEQLRQAAKTGDVEIRTRCEKLIEKLEAKLTADKLLAPKKVRLNVKDVTVLAAIEELQKISGYPISIAGDRDPLTKRTIALDTGLVTFWEAFDRLCEQGNLTQVTSDLASNVVPIRRVGVPQVLPANPPGLPVPPPAGGAAPAAPKAGQGVEQKMLPPQGQAQIPAGAGNGPVIVLLPLEVGQAQPVPVQVQGQIQVGQAQPAPPVQVQVQGQVQIVPGRTQLPQRGTPAGTLVVRDGTFAKVPTFYSGAVRIRLLPANLATEIVVQPRQQGEALFVLEACAEPRLQMFGVTGNPSVQMALDELGQQLAVAMEPMPELNANGGVPVVYYGNRTVRQAALRLKQGAQKAAELTKLKGTIAIESLTPEAEALVTVPNLDKALGQKIEGAKGGFIEVRSFQRQDDGTYKVQVSFQAPQPFYPATPIAPGAPLPGGAMKVPPPGGAAVPAGQAGVQVLPAGGAAVQPGFRPTPVNPASQAYLYPQLVDAKGKTLTLEQLPQRGARAVNGVVVQELTMVFRSGEGVGEPTQAILFGHRKVTAEAPFAFKHIPLQ